MQNKITVIISQQSTTTQHTALQNYSNFYNKGLQLMQCNTKQQHNAMRHGGIQNNAISCCNTIGQAATQINTVQCNAIHSNAAQCNTKY